MTKKNESLQTIGPAFLTDTDAKSLAQQVLRTIDESDNPAPLVGQLPAHDLLFVWSEADKEKRADLMRLCTPEQARLLVDLTCWSDDRMDIAAVEELFEPLVEGGVAGAVMALDKMEDEVRTLVLARHVVVHQMENRNEPVPAADTSDLISFPDGYYHVEVPHPELLSATQRTLFKALMYKPFEDYHKELECLRWELPSQLEDLAYRWRCGRLGDLGFLPYEEAVALLTPREVEEVRRLASKDLPELPWTDFDMPVVFRQSFAGDDFLDQVMSLLMVTTDPDEIERVLKLRAELGAMTSQFLTAVRVPLGDIEAVQGGIRMARDLCSLGLRLVSDHDVAAASRMMISVTPGLFLQAALGRLMPLRHRATSIMKGFAAVNADALDPPHRVVVSLLCRDIPMRWPPLEDRFRHSIVPLAPLDREVVAFSHPTDVDAADRLLCEAELLPRFCEEVLGTTVDNLPRRPVSASIAAGLVASAKTGRLDPGSIDDEEFLRFSHSLEGDQEAQLEQAARAISIAWKTEAADPVAIDDDPDPKKRLVARLARLAVDRLWSGDVGD